MIEGQDVVTVTAEEQQHAEELGDELPAVLPGGVKFNVSQTTFADPEGNEFELVLWQQQPE